MKFYKYDKVVVEKRHNPNNWSCNFPNWMGEVLEDAEDGSCVLVKPNDIDEIWECSNEQVILFVNERYWIENSSS